MTKPSFETEVEALKKVMTALEVLTPEGQKWVIGTAADRLKIANGYTQVPAAILPGAQPLRTTVPIVGANAGQVSAVDISTMSVKDFIKYKKPQSDPQRIACLGYYLAQNQGVMSFKGKQIGDLNTLSAGPKFNISRALENSMRQNKFLAAAGPALKQLSPLGESVVEALPDQTAVAAAIAEAGMKPKKKTKKATKK